jgi:hypothetical protein
MYEVTWISDVIRNVVSDPGGRILETPSKSMNICIRIQTVCRRRLLFRMFGGSRAYENVSNDACQKN